jgi:hypothetical protein
LPTFYAANDSTLCSAIHQTIFPTVIPAIDSANSATFRTAKFETDHAANESANESAIYATYHSAFDAALISAIDTTICSAIGPAY